MKALVCELCGSNDMVKQDGMFVCQFCGTKYTVEEAKKLLIEINGPVEVEGTVKVDSTAQADNYLSLLRTAYSGKDIEGIVKYSEKVLELDPNNYEAWELRAKSVCWQSSLNDMKISQAIAAAKKAIELAPEEKKSKLADEIYLECKKTIVALLGNAYKMPASMGVGYVHNVMMRWNDMLVGIPSLSEQLIKRELDDCKTLCKQSKRALVPPKTYINAARVGLNKKLSYDKMFMNNLGLK